MLRSVGKWLRNNEVSLVIGKGLQWEGFVKKVGFELGMKEQGSYG